MMATCLSGNVDIDVACDASVSFVLTGFAFDAFNGQLTESADGALTSTSWQFYRLLLARAKNINNSSREWI